MQPRSIRILHNMYMYQRYEVLTPIAFRDTDKLVTWRHNVAPTLDVIKHAYSNALANVDLFTRFTKTSHKLRIILLLNYLNIANSFKIHDYDERSVQMCC